MLIKRTDRVEGRILNFSALLVLFNMGKALSSHGPFASWVVQEGELGRYSCSVCRPMGLL